MIKKGTCFKVSELSKAAGRPARAGESFHVRRDRFRYLNWAESTTAPSRRPLSSALA